MPLRGSSECFCVCVSWYIFLTVYGTQLCVYHAPALPMLLDTSTSVTSYQGSRVGCVPYAFRGKAKGPPLTCLCMHREKEKVQQQTIHDLCDRRSVVVVAAVAVAVAVVGTAAASCHRLFLTGSSPLQPAVIPTAQASTFRLQYFPCCV